MYNWSGIDMCLDKVKKSIWLIKKKILIGLTEINISYASNGATFNSVGKFHSDKNFIDQKLLVFIAIEALKSIFL